MSDLIDRCWFFQTLAVTVAPVDFLDPAIAEEPRARERGVRVEIRLVTTHDGGTIYASPGLTLAPAVCRIDLLESAPGAADRMHWHPVMADGEPGDRSYDPAMPSDPTAWLSGRLREVDALLERCGVPDAEHHRATAAAVARASDEIVDAVRAGLAWARTPWPDVGRDARGMAVARS